MWCYLQANGDGVVLGPRLVLVLRRRRRRQQQRDQQNDGWYCRSGGGCRPALVQPQQPQQPRAQLQPLLEMDEKIVVGEEDAAVGAVASVESLVSVPDNLCCLRPRHVGTGHVVGRSYRDDGGTPD